MKRNSLLVLSAFLLLVAACGKKGGKTGLMVPKDAAIVVHINSKSLSSKLSWDEIKQTKWFQEMSKEATDTLATQLLTDPSSSGIDTKDDMVFYMKRQGRGGYLVFQGGLIDASAFEKMVTELKKKNERTSDVKKEGDFSYVTSGDNGAIVWNKSKFVFIANSPMPDMTNIMKRGGSGRSYEFLNDSLRLFAQQSLALKGDDNLDADSRFADMVTDGSDIHVWMSVGSYYGDLGSMMSMMRFNVLFEDNVSATSLNFDNGKITAKSKQYYGEEMRKLLAKYQGSNVSEETINRIPSSNVAAVFAFNYPPDGLQAFLKLIGVDGMVNSYLAEMNYSIEEFIKANKGEILLSISDISIVQKTDTIKYEGMTEPYIHTSTKPDMKVLFATAVNDKAAFEKLVTLAWETSKNMGAGDKMPAISYKIENNWFAASNAADFTNNFLSNKGTKQAFANKITGHPSGFYIDLQKIIQSSTSNMKSDSSANAMIDASLKMWQDVTGYGGEYKDKAMVYDFEVNLVDKNTNSLKQLNQYLDKVATVAREKKDMYREDVPMQDTIVTPDMK